jgi:hypothetical protein
VDLFLKRKNVVLLAWDCIDIDHNYSPQAFFGDVKMLQESANKGMILMRVLLDAELDYSNADMTVSRSLIAAQLILVLVYTVCLILLILLTSNVLSRML